MIDLNDTPGGFPECEGGGGCGCAQVMGFIFSFVLGITGAALVFMSAGTENGSYNSDYNWDGGYFKSPISMSIDFSTIAYTDASTFSDAVLYSDCAKTLGNGAAPCATLELCATCGDVGGQAQMLFVCAGVFSALALIIFIFLWLCYTNKNQGRTALLPHLIKTILAILSLSCILSALSTFSPCLNEIQDFVDECGDEDIDYYYENGALVDVTIVSASFLSVNAVLSVYLLYSEWNRVSATVQRNQTDSRRAETERNEREQEMQNQSTAAKDNYYGSSSSSSSAANPPAYGSPIL